MSLPTGSDPKIARRFKTIKNVIIVLSGKGGVGKSSVSAQLALSLSSTPVPVPIPLQPNSSSTSQDQSNGITSSSNTQFDSNATTRIPRVGILDLDLTGPSIPRMLGLDGQSVRQSSDGWVPVYADREQRLAVMSVGFLLKSKNDSVVWRGPKKNAMVRQFLADVRWGELDYLIIDTPPGTSDEHISLLEYLAGYNPSAVMVTTPQAVSLADNLRSLDFTRKTSLPLLGLIENMSGYVCPHCEECTNVWGKGGGESLAQREGIHFLGRIPIDPGLVRVLDDAKEEAFKKIELSDSADKEEKEKAIKQALVAEDGTRPKEIEENQGIHSAKLVNGTGEKASSTQVGDGSSNVQAESTTPAGTILSRTLIQRYRDSQTFPIFQKITTQIVQFAKERKESAEMVGGVENVSVA